MKAEEARKIAIDNQYKAIEEAEKETELILSYIEKAAMKGEFNSTISDFRVSDECLRKLHDLGYSCVFDSKTGFTHIYWQFL